MKKYSRNKYCFPSEFTEARRMAGFSIKAAAKICCRTERSIEDWEAGRSWVPAWALRLMILESRYMDALYGLQADRGRTGFALGMHRSTMAANDAKNDAIEVDTVRLVHSGRSRFGPSMP